MSCEDISQYSHIALNIFIWAFVEQYNDLKAIL